MNRNSEYAPAKNLDINKMILENFDVKRMDANRVISAIRLMVGGPAMLATVKKNHINVINGNIDCNPFVRNRLRVCVDSYIELAMANRPEDLKPWAIIIIRAPS